MGDLPASRSNDEILAVFRAHGTLVAATWAGLATATVVQLAKRVDGYDRGRGHPTLHELIRRLPTIDCTCPRCADWRATHGHGFTCACPYCLDQRKARAGETNLRYAATLPSILDDGPRPWVTQAACLGADPDIFHPRRGESAAPAKACCAHCPVTTECLDYAERHHIHHGIWGGLSARERKRRRTASRTAIEETA